MQTSPYVNVWRALWNTHALCPLRVAISLTYIQKGIFFKTFTISSHMQITTIMTSHQNSASIASGFWEANVGVGWRVCVCDVDVCNVYLLFDVGKACETSWHHGCVMCNMQIPSRKNRMGHENAGHSPSSVAFDVWCMWWKWSTLIYCQ